MVPASRSYFAAMPTGTEVSRRNRFNASSRIQARLCELSPARVRFVASPIATSGTQCPRFSISQCVRITLLMRFASSSVVSGAS